jgi:hypothetical protein
MGVNKPNIIMFFSFISAWSQNDTIQYSHFKTYNETITTSLYYLDTSNSFEIIYNANNTTNYLNFEPNKRAQVGVNLSYRIIDLSVGFSPSFLAENKDNSNSKHFTLSTRLYLKKWMQSLTFINQTGFYISEAITETEFPRMRTTKIGGTTSYIFNDKFSFKTLANQKEWQTISAGSFIPNFSVYYTNIDLNTPEAGNQSDIFIFSLAPSYFYNLVLQEKVLLSAGVSAGYGLNSVDGDTYGIFELSSNFKIGYNTDTFFTFINYNYSKFTQNAKAQIRLNDEINTIKFTLGYRFKAPKKLNQLYDKANKKIGI